MDLAKVDLVKIREKSGFSEHVCETPAWGSSELKRKISHTCLFPVAWGSSELKGKSVTSACSP